MRKLAVGVGNELRGDDAIGLRIVDGLRGSRLAGRVDLRLIERDLFEIESWFENYEKMAVIDALPPGGSPGRLKTTVVEPGFLPNRRIYSLHDMDLLWQLQLISGSFEGGILLVGVEARSLDFSVNLSQELARKLPLLVERTAAAIESFMAYPEAGGASLPFRYRLCLSHLRDGKE